MLGVLPFNFYDAPGLPGACDLFISPVKPGVRVGLEPEASGDSIGKGLESERCVFHPIKFASAVDNERNAETHAFLAAAQFRILCFTPQIWFGLTGCHGTQRTSGRPSCFVDKRPVFGVLPDGAFLELFTSKFQGCAAGVGVGTPSDHAILRFGFSSPGRMTIGAGSTLTSDRGGITPSGEVRPTKSAL